MTNFPFAVAATQGTSRVMGLTLLPFSIGHKVLLEREQSPFLSADQKPSFRDLLKAVLICSQPFHTKRSGFWFAVKLKLWLWRVRRLDWFVEIQKMREHISFGSLCPRIKNEGGRPPGSAWPLRLFQFLTLVLKVPEAKAWDYPYGKAQFEWCAFWESEGAIKVWNDQDEEFDRFCKEQDALEAAEIAKRKAKREAA
jgi:hypothetical protein